MPNKTDRKYQLQYVARITKGETFVQVSTIFFFPLNSFRSVVGSQPRTPKVQPAFRSFNQDCNGGPWQRLETEPSSCCLAMGLGSGEVCVFRLPTDSLGKTGRVVSAERQTIVCSDLDRVSNILSHYLVPDSSLWLPPRALLYQDFIL